MSAHQNVVAFDIGIRNLAWCFLEKTGTGWSIRGWENYDLLAGTETQKAKDAAKVSCLSCGKRAAFQVAGKSPTCATHCPDSHPPLRDASGALLKRLPKAKELLALCGTSVPRKKTKPGILEHLSAKFSLPLEPAKLTKGKAEDVASLHDSIQKFVEERKELFKSCGTFLLENQPAFKNPTMKTVQILLFATLRERLLPLRPAVGFVHAGKKVQGKEKGDKGYVQRKKGSEDRVGEFFEKQSIVEKESWLKLLRENQKKSDLCDALCMCLDRLQGS